MNFERLVGMMKLINESLNLEESSIKNISTPIMVLSKALEKDRINFEITIKKILPFLETLSRTVDQATCAILSEACFVMPERPDQVFLSELSNASIENDVVFISNDEVKEDLSIDAINKAISSYLEKTNYRLTEKLIVTIDDELRGNTLWTESMETYRQGRYSLSILGFAVLTDKLLSKYTGNTVTSITKRAEQIVKKIQEGQSGEKDIAEAYLINTFDYCAKKFDLFKDFESDEPALLNRHWLIHGRREIPVTQLDCIKTIHILYGTVVLGKALEKNNG